MARQRIAVGFDGSPGSRQALTWAVREAARRRGSVLVVRAWQTRPRPADSPALRSERIALDEQLCEAISLAQLELAAHPVPGTAGDPAPPVGRELIISDPVTALCHVARMADVVAVGAGPDVPAVLAPRLAHRRHRFGGPCPLVVVVPNDCEPSVADPHDREPAIAEPHDREPAVAEPYDREPGLIAAQNREPAAVPRPRQPAAVPAGS